MKKCPLCGGKILKAKIKDYVYDTSLGDITIKGISRLAQCKACNRIFVTGSLMEKWNKELLKKLALIKRTLKPKELVFAFSALPYDQKEIADAVGRDKTTLSKYKNGANPPDHAFDFLLKKIMLDWAEGIETTMNQLRNAYKDDTGHSEITSLSALPR